MAHLLHIDSSIQGDASVSRRLTALTAAAWRAAHPGGTVTYRDFGAEPLPHLDAAGGTAFMLPPDQHTPAQAATYARGLEVVGDVQQADTVILGLPLYNFGPPSSIKSWVDHLIIGGVSFDPATGEGKLSGREFIVLGSRGGGYGEGTPREGWDHAHPWLPHGVSMTGLEPRFITAELTLAKIVPAMADLIGIAEQSLEDAEREIQGLWEPAIEAVA
jgi:FMN-dependent NADH-azoreductase